MKNMNRITFAAAVAASLSLIASASAQFKPVEEDGIAASPKIRQMLNERKADANPAPAEGGSVGYQATGRDGITAPPSVRQRLSERKVITSTPSTAFASVGYQATGEDGITASPKVRQQLNERGGTPVMIAPLK